MIRRLRRAVTGGGRRVRPAPASVAALWVTVAVAAGVAAWAWHSATRSASPARTLALAAAVTPGGIPLDSALEVTWTWSVGGTAALEDRWASLVAPALPPGLCPADGGTTGNPLPAELRRLDQAVGRPGTSRAELERRIAAVRAAAGGYGADAAEGARTDFLVRYGLARGYAAAGDWAAAADVLEPVFGGWLSPERVPDTDREAARRAVRAGRVDGRLASDAVHGRYLAGTIAYHRGEAEGAVGWFRRAINAVHYLLALRGEDPLGADGHYQRVVVDAGASRCAGARAGDALTSLDAYAGLVAAYMADTGFRDPGGLPREVGRTRLQIDADDPFAPVLRHARMTGGRPGRTPVPENLLWAASNLQRVYHHNRLRPDPRLAVTRAVLLLHLTGDSTWLAALQRSGGAEPCAMLGALAEDLQGDVAALGPRGRGTGVAADDPGAAPPAVDSARAAVAVQTFARLERSCPGGAGSGNGGARGDGAGGGDGVRRAVDPGVRSAWIRLGGGHLTRGVGSAFESMRAELAAVLSGDAAAAPVAEARARPVLERARAIRSGLHRGRVPPEMPADLPVEPVRRYVDEWWRALFADVVDGLIVRVRAPEAPGRSAPPPLRAGQVGDYLLALESAVAHAGMRPSDVYRAEELAGLAAPRGGASALGWRLRTAARDRPVLAALVLAAAVALVAALALLVHVSAWRFRLFTSQRLYVEELRGLEPPPRAGGAR